MDAAVSERLADLTFDEAASVLRGADVAYAQVSSLIDLNNHPALRTYEVATASGRVRLPLSSGRELPPGAEAPRVPRCDEHGTAIRTEFAN